MESPSKNRIAEDLRAALVASGHRFTSQRAAIYDYLRRVTTHPTADEIFKHVRAEIPDISLATVYKALEAFVNAGAARKLEFASGPARYDGRTDKHHHTRCIECGTVRDVEGAADFELESSPSADHDFEVVGYRLELLGYCPACRN